MPVKANREPIQNYGTYTKAEHLRVRSFRQSLPYSINSPDAQVGLSMLADTGRWPAIYGQIEYPSLAMLSSLTVNNRGNVVIGANIAPDRKGTNHRGPLVWLCHEASCFLFL
jgi:hypothetical protein